MGRLRQDRGWRCDRDGQDEAQARALFQERYRNTPSLLTRQIEQRVIGGDWSANDTTMAKPTPSPASFTCRPPTTLLDLGSGRGWPGLYLAARTGCRVVLADLPLEGLRVAANRATSEALAARTGVVAAAASGLPFPRAGGFDVIIPAPMCCVDCRLSVLKACRRLLRPGGRIGYHHP